MKASDLEEIVDNLWKVCRKLDDEGHDECARQVMACASKLSYLILRELDEMRFSLSEEFSTEDLNQLIEDFKKHEAD